MQILEPNFRLPCIRTLLNRLALIYNVVADKIKSKFSAASVVALTSDCWFSRSQDSYVTVTAFTLGEMESKKLHTSYGRNE